MQTIDSTARYGLSASTSGSLSEILRCGAGHGTGFDAFEDSVFYNPDMLTIRPPFTIAVRNAPKASRVDIERMAEGWAFQRQWRRANYGDDVEASIIALP